jgi:peptidyl-prolyl cis-trans isomerase SurA
MRPASHGREGRPSTGYSGVKQFAKKLGQMGAGGALLVGLWAVAASGQEVAGAAASPEDAFNIPDNVVMLGATNPNQRRATAIVNGTIITGTDVEHRLALILAANNAVDIPAEEIQRLRLQVLRNLIDETLQIQEAAAQDMAVERAEVEEAFEDLANERFEGSVETLENYLRERGSSPASLKRQIEGELAWNRLLQRNVSIWINVSAEEVDEVYQRVLTAKGTAEYRLAEIFLSANQTNDAAVAENARRIVEQLRQGASFPAYARQFSEASSAIVGGDLGWMRLEQLQNPQLEAAAAALSPGQLVGPIEIPGGYSILLLIDRRQIGLPDPRDAVLSLMQIALDFPPGTTEEEARRQATIFAETVQQIRGCGDAQGKAAAIGATVVVNDQIPVRELPEQLQEPMLQLNVGEATPAFGTLAEGDGVRVLMLCGRDDPATLGPDREQIASAIEEDRINKRAQRYLRDLRRDAVIDYN